VTSGHAWYVVRLARVSVTCQPKCQIAVCGDVAGGGEQGGRCRCVRVERVEVVGRHGAGRGQGGENVGRGVFGALVHVHLGRRERRADRVHAAGEQPWNPLRGGDAGVEGEAGVYLPPLRILRAGERLGQGFHLRLREAAIGLRPRAAQ